jgi:CRISPR-associated protein Cas2
MIIISYDIKNNKLRTKFSKYIKKYGYRLQYSVYEITNSENMLLKIKQDIENIYKKSFSNADSVIILKTSKNCEITKFGYAKNDDSDIIYMD